jgi:hypothetical protein
VTERVSHVMLAAGTEERLIQRLIVSLRGWS